MECKVKMSSNDHDTDFFYIDDIQVHAVTVSQMHPGLSIKITLDGPQGEFHVATIDPTTSDRIGCRYGGAKLIRAHARQQGEEQCGLCKLAHDSRKCPQLYDLLSYFPKQISELEAENVQLKARVAELAKENDRVIERFTDIDANNAGLCVHRDNLNELLEAKAAQVEAWREAADKADATIAVLCNYVEQDLKRNINGDEYVCMDDSDSALAKARALDSATDAEPKSE